LRRWRRWGVLGHDDHRLLLLLLHLLLLPTEQAGKGNDESDYYERHTTNGCGGHASQTPERLSRCDEREAYPEQHQADEKSEDPQSRTPRMRADNEQRA
jgi:hypothetical protein